VNGTRPRGRVLVVGPDGSGKSTLTAAIAERAGAAGVPVTQAHWRPAVIRPGSGDGEPVVDPHRQPPRGLSLTVIRMLVFVADFAVGMAGPWRAASRDGLLVLERGWLDMAVDPRRYRLPGWAARVVESLGGVFARADVTLLLSGDPAVLDGRVGEIGVAETERQIRRWRALAPRWGGRVVEIDTTRNDADVVAERAWAAVTAARTG
jgi:energy-coupling factor transporter ATP-binding protein EcfA2